LADIKRKKGRYAWCKELLKLYTRVHQKRAKDGLGHPFPRIRDKVVSNGFEAGLGVLIVANCAVIGWRAQTASQEPDEATKITLFALEQIFTIFFSIELLLRLIVYNWTMFFVSENWLDIFLVSIGTFSAWIAGPMNLDLDFLRKLTVLRTLRLTRLGRAVRHRPEFQDMWALMKGLTDSFETLFWTYIMIGCVLYLFAIIGTYLIGNLASFEDDPIAEEYFKDVPRAMLTLFQVMTLDSWTGIMRPLMKKEAWVCWYFIIFITVGTFVLMNLIIAVVVENAFENANEDSEEVARQMEEKKTAELEDLRKTFRSMDEDESGTINREELMKSMRERHDIRQKFRSLDIKPTDIDEIWQILDDGSGEISIYDFVDGIRRLQGEAKSKDIIRLQRELKILQNSAEDTAYSMNSSRGRLTYVRKQLRRTSADIEAFRRTMARAKEAVKLASKSQRVIK
jgi:voltage-gated sodium channel